MKSGWRCAVPEPARHLASASSPDAQKTVLRFIATLEQLWIGQHSVDPYGHLIVSLLPVQPIEKQVDRVLGDLVSRLSDDDVLEQRQSILELVVSPVDVGDAEDESGPFLVTAPVEGAGGRHLVQTRDGARNRDQWAAMAILAHRA